MIWSEADLEFLRINYPEKGKEWCMQQLNRSEAAVRHMAYLLKLKQNKNSEFFKEWQDRAKLSKVGKKRPIHSAIMKLKGSPHLVEYSKTHAKEISERNKAWIKENGHPKGATGMKHTEKTKKVLSEKSKSMWENMSEEMRDAFSKRASINGNKTTMNRSNASWKADWREIGGYRKYYRSRWEANYARYLEWLKVNKQIIDWKHEPDTFWFEGIKRGVMSYLPDFKVTELNMSIAYHEVKGWMDARSITKIKRMAKYHPTVKLIVIDSKAYKSLEKKAKLFVKGWES
jgi:hypothetical protein